MIAPETSQQKIFEGTDSYRNIEQIVAELSPRKILIVCGSTFQRSGLPDFFTEKGLEYCIYDGFQPNPTYENVLEGLRVFHDNHCDLLISIGGGSAIDVAKCIKAYAAMEPFTEYIRQDIPDSGIPHLAMPTTAGTGSESTHFAVMYYKGEKMSVSAPCLLPEYVILEPMLLATLPDYQKKSTLLDALCQATESYWSVNASSESQAYAKEAITLILRYAKPYIRANTHLIEIFHAANLAGRAINLTQTTLAHAMSYKLTSLYKISHGHAVALCMPYVWEYLAAHADSPQETQTLSELNDIYHCSSTEETVTFFRGMLAEFELETPDLIPEDIEILAASVNEQRMQNFPAAIQKSELADMYRHILTDNNKPAAQNRLLYNTACDMRRLETISPGRQYKMLGLQIQERPKTLRVEAAGTLIEALLAFGQAESDSVSELQHIISELMISLPGYIQGKEVDLINYVNAAAELNKYRIPVSEAEKNQAEQLKNNAHLTAEHALLLCRFQKLAAQFEQNQPPLSGIFEAKTNEVNIQILQGMLCQFDLLLKHKDSKEPLLQIPADRIHAHQMILLWKNAKARFYERKFNHYLSELRKVQLEMMDEIARVCDKHHLTYVLNYGSLLGAVRHQGFIPWDDDLDICMPRDDYEKFLEISRKEFQKGCYLYNNEDFHDCWFSMMKVMKKDTVFVRHPYRFGERDGQRVFIDVWPLDNVTGPDEAARKMKKQKSVLTRLLRLKIKARTGGELSMTQQIRQLLLKPVSENWLIQKRNQLMTQWRNQETEYWMSGGVYDYMKETMPKSWYLPTAVLPFEGHEYKVPGNYVEILKHFYGNYMQVPPVDKRYTHAPFQVQMQKHGETLYFSETQRRRRRSLRSKLIRKAKKLWRTGRKAMDPAIQRIHATAVTFTSIFRALTPNGRRLLAYKNKYAGQTCYIIANSSFLTQEEISAVKQGISFAGDNCYPLSADRKWHPDFYCISEKARKGDRIPSPVRDSKTTQIFYTSPAAKGRRKQLKSGIRIASRKAGKKPSSAVRIDRSYYDTGSGNFIFLLELAVYMGFQEIIIAGFDRSYATYHMNHFPETEKLDTADRRYETYQIFVRRYQELLEQMAATCHITEYRKETAR